MLESGVGMIWFHVKVQALPRARTLNTTVLVGVAGTGLYTWVVREGATGWWGISPPEGRCGAICEVLSTEGARKHCCH